MKFLNDIVLTGAGADLTAPATVTFSGLSATTETNAVVVNSSGVLSKRTLGSNAFNSTTIPTNAVLTTGNQTIAGVKTFSNNLTVGSNSLTAGSLDINGNADISGNLTGVDAFTASGKIQGAELEGTSLDINGNGDISGTLTANVVNMNGGDVNGNLYADRYFQAATGVPTNNLGSPTVTEMALFENQFKPQTTLANSYNDLSDLTFFTRASGTTEGDYTEVTSYSDDQKRKFLRTHNSGVEIPNTHNSFRVEFTGYGYNYANAMVAYWSSDSHNTQVHVWKRRCSDNTWIQHTSSSTTISSWPGHMYLPFGTIPWHETNTTSTGHFNKIRIEFTPNWIPYSGSGTDYSTRAIKLYGMQIWGGYPSGKRTVHNYDQNGKLDLFKDLGLPDNGVATFGNGDDLQIYHDGSNSYIQDSGTGNLKIRTNALNVMNAANSENMLSATENGAVTLYYDNASKLTTASGGINVTGTITSTGQITGTELEGTSLDINGNADISGNLTVSSNSSVVAARKYVARDGNGTGLFADNGTSGLIIADSGNASFTGTLGIGSLTNPNTDTDRFLVADSTKVVRFRTGAEVRSDIGAGTGNSNLALGVTPVTALRGDLVTTTSSTSTTQAATANAVRLAYNRGSLGVTNAATAQTTAAAALSKAGGTMSGAINMGNNNISGVNAIQMADPGPSEGVTWTNTKIFESPNDLTTNSAGNFQVVHTNTRRLTVDTSGIDVNGNIVVSGTVDGVDISALPTSFLAIGTTSTTALAGNTTIPAAESYTQHENISAATSVNGTGRAYIQDITVDSNGHVTGIATATETVVNTNTQNSAATTRGFFSGSGINTSTGVITNTTYTKAGSTALGLVKIGEGIDIDAGGTISTSTRSAATTSEAGDMSASDKTKLDGIGSQADRTGTTNVAAAGASMKTSTETISGTKTFSALTTISNTTDSSSAAGTNGALRTAGGASVAKKLYVGSTITGSADVIAYSDKRLKKNVKTLDGKKVLEMRGVSFERTDSGKQSSGVIAQEMEKVAPELVIDDGNYKGVAYGNVVGYLIEAIKDQQKQIDELKAIIDGGSK